MKKIKPIFIVLLIAAVLMGAGYAAWTDSNTVEGTIGTGVLSVVINNDEGYEPLLNLPIYMGGSSPFVWEGNKGMDFGISNLYPTVYDPNDSETFAELVFQLNNVGTVPVKLAGLNVEISGPNGFALTGKGHGGHGPGHGHGDGSGNDPGNDEEDLPTPDLDSIWSHLWVEIQGATGDTTFDPIKCKLAELNSVLSELDLDCFVIYPDGSLNFNVNNYIRFWLDEESGNEDQDKSVDFSLTFDWKQFNM